MLPLQIHLTLPPWMDEVADIGRPYASDEERVGLAIECRAWCWRPVWRGGVRCAHWPHCFSGGESRGVTKLFSGAC